MNPEFLREGSAVQDFLNPPLNIIGTRCEKGFKLLKEIYTFNKAPVERVNEEVAEMIKLVANSFHGLKISFANEIGNLCKKIGVDSNEIMRILCEDKKLNISSAYLKPGFAFGGSCLPKDIKAISRLAGDFNIKVPVIASLKSTNDLQKRKTFELIKAFGKKKISIWGLSFKIGTDDLRGSPVIDVINMLVKEGYNVKVFDQNVHLDKIIGSNKEYIEKNFPAINKIFVKDIIELINHSKLLVINSCEKKIINEIKKNEDLIILDLLDIAGIKKMKGYTGLCW
jgi:GDP-mannose 6-dehydrogenase